MSAVSVFLGGTKRRLKKATTRASLGSDDTLSRARAPGARPREAMAGRKRCHHGRQKTHCKVCSPCPHGKVKSNCADCYPCPHGRLKSNCADCNPCPHGKVKGNCAKCNLCPHGKHKHRCTACKATRAGQAAAPRKRKRDLE